MIPEKQSRSVRKSSFLHPDGHAAELTAQKLRCIFILILCLCLLCPAAPSSAEEEQAEETVRHTDRFGSDVTVETDENGTSVAVNGYPAFSVRAGFNSLGQSDSFQMTVTFMDYPFWQPATEYDGNLAVMSLAMACCANRAFGYSGRRF